MVITVVDHRQTRREQARETRIRLLDAALRLFVAHGYEGTTVQAIAREAHVAVQTVYFKFGTKQQILKELVDVRVAGDDEPIPTMERAWVRAALEETDARSQLRRQADGTREVYRRVGDILEVVRNAALSNAEMAELWNRNKQQRLEVQEHFIEAFTSKRPLPADVTPQRAVDVSYSILGPEMYYLLVSERGWTPQEWADWAYSSLCQYLMRDA